MGELAVPAILKFFILPFQHFSLVRVPSLFFSYIPPRAEAANKDTLTWPPIVAQGVFWRLLMLR